MRIFCRSHVKNDVLPKNCQAEFNDELNLSMGNRTRWNSSLKMLSRFLEIRTALEKALKNSDHSSRYFHENEDSLTKDLKELSKLLKLGHSSLSRHDVTLLKSEKTFKFIIQQLSQETGQIVFQRIKSRQNKNICGLIRYLEWPQHYDQISQQSRLEYQRNKELPKVARDLLVRLFPDEATDKNEANYDQSSI